MPIEDSAKYQLRLFGTVRLLSPDGQDITPRLRKSQALLAILALAEERRIARPRLQSLLWSDRMQTQGRDSLKKALSEIRHAFGDGEDCPLETDGGPVRLRLDRIDVDALSEARFDKSVCPPRLLEGLGIKDPRFADWLAGMRAQFDRSRTRSPVDLPSASRNRRRLTIAVLPSSVMAERNIDFHVAQLVRHGLSRTLRQSGVFEVYEAQGTADERADLTLSLTLADFRGQTILDVRLVTSDDRHELWSSSDILDMSRIDPRAISVLVQVMADQICQKVRLAGELGDERQVVSRSVLSAIEQLFRLSDNDIEGAEATLARAAETLPSSPIYAWYAYLTAFQVEKNGRKPETIDKADSLAAQAMELDPTNPLTRALVSHVHSFVLRDFDRAGEILEPVKGLAGNNVMLADAIGLLHYYRGEYQDAQTYAQLSCELGPWSRFRYAFTTSLSMTQLMLGDYDGAIASSRRAIAQHPLRSTHVFEPTLRTLACALSLSGRTKPARDALRRLDRQTGHRTVERLTSPEESPFPNVETFNVVKSSLERLHA